LELTCNFQKTYTERRQIDRIQKVPHPPALQVVLRASSFAGAIAQHGFEIPSQARSKIYALLSIDIGAAGRSRT